ncbi:hypothetical protein TESG_00373 [Trichophyton tonsurans CBS 112818]|uniref:Uncharacterized protein n=1 Tax=Trichophyton tonsurans (strain CBS 112818) TaxID=647933 RepID=F2RNA7_TRIT1|nr:hypothetical protein TESG_00373 [Trichophyton tonsurans CBS 112818]
MVKKKKKNPQRPLRRLLLLETRQRSRSGINQLAAHGSGAPRGPSKQRAAPAPAAAAAAPPLPLLMGPRWTAGPTVRRRFLRELELASWAWGTLVRRGRGGG